MCPDSRALPEEPFMVQLRRQVHWMADEILRSLFDANPGAAESWRAKPRAMGLAGTRRSGASSTVGLHRKLRNALDRRVVARRVVACSAFPSPNGHAANPQGQSDTKVG